MNRRMLLLLGFVALLVVLTSWLSRQGEVPAPGRAKAPAHQPDYFIHGMQATLTGPDGQPTHHLLADTLYHYPDDDTSELENPDIRVFGVDSANWHAIGREGFVAGKQGQLTLRGEVRLRQEGAEELDVQTDWLLIDSKRRYAETDAPVTLTTPDSRVEGIGLKAYGQEQRMQLLSSVRGRYETR